MGLKFTAGIHDFLRAENCYTPAYDETQTYLETINIKPIKN